MPDSQASTGICDPGFIPDPHCHTVLHPGGPSARVHALWIPSTGIHSCPAGLSDSVRQASRAWVDPTLRHSAKLGGWRLHYWCVSVVAGAAGTGVKAQGFVVLRASGSDWCCYGPITSRLCCSSCHLQFTPSSPHRAHPESHKGVQ